MITTFDKKAQDAAVAAAQKYTESAKAADEKASNLHAAVASVDVDTGEVLASTAARTTSRTPELGHHASAHRLHVQDVRAGRRSGRRLQPVLAVQRQHLHPARRQHPGAERVQQPVRPAVPLLRATAQSINTAFVDLVTSMDNGAKKTMEMAEAVGAPKGAGWDDNSRLLLGTAEVSPLAQASAYATFANDGVRVPEHVVREVRSREGKVLYKAAPEEKRAVSEEIAADVNFALSSVVDGGTGRAAQSLNRPVAGKTGTKDREDDIVSAWFVGYTKQISTADVRRRQGWERRPRPVRASRGLHLLRRHLPRADLGRVHGRGHRGSAGGGLRRTGVREPGQVLEPTLRPEPSETQEPTETKEPEPTTQTPNPSRRRPRSRAPSLRPVHRRPRPSPRPSNTRRASPNPKPSKTNDGGQGPGEEDGAAAERTH